MWINMCMYKIDVKKLIFGLYGDIVNLTLAWTYIAKIISVRVGKCV